MTRCHHPGPCALVRGKCLQPQCRHIETVPVESVVTGKRLAVLCLTCDAQLPADYVNLAALISESHQRYTASLMRAVENAPNIVPLKR